MSIMLAGMGCNINKLEYKFVEVSKSIGCSLGCNINKLEYKLIILIFTYYCFSML